MVDPKTQREANVPSLVRIRRKVRLIIISTSFKGTWSSWASGRWASVLAAEDNARARAKRILKGISKR